MMFTPKAREQPWMGPNTGIGKMKKNLSHPRGFTLIELIIVLTIIGILVGLGIPQYTYSVKRAREAVLKEDLFQMRKLINQYYTDKKEYPPSLQALVDEGYLKKIPVDPITQSSETWEVVRQTLTQEEMMSGKQPGVVDVFSGSEEISTKGTPYNTW